MSIFFLFLILNSSLFSRYINFTTLESNME
nr:MAG TPA: hypothetical protein [Caudoviricetes sp.]